MVNLKQIIIIITFGMFLGCASIPSEAPDLSAELGEKINAIESSHITLIHKFFDQKKDQVDQFIIKEWTPIFAKEFFSDPKVSKIWKEIVRENNEKDRLEFLIRFGPPLQKKITKKRLELIKPLEGLENEIIKKIRTEYVQVRALNNTITSFLVSASKVSENRTRYLEMLGVSDEKINSLIEKADESVSTLVKGAKTVTEKVDKSKAFIKNINDLKNKLL